MNYGMLYVAALASDRAGGMDERKGAALMEVSCDWLPARMRMCVRQVLAFIKHTLRTRRTSSFNNSLVPFPSLSASRRRQFLAERRQLKRLNV